MKAAGFYKPGLATPRHPFHHPQAVDSSSDFISFAQGSITNPSVRFMVGLAESLELETNSIDAVVSGLVLNFVPQPEAVISEMMRVSKPGGVIGIFLWDYADGMEILRYFWDAAVELDIGAKEFDEGCNGWVAG